MGILIFYLKCLSLKSAFSNLANILLDFGPILNLFFVVVLS